MGTPIPKRLHLFWDGPAQPDYVARSITSWAAHHPGWDVHLWNSAALPPLRNQDLYDDPRRYSPKSNIWQHRTNLARLEILHDIGGVWADADLEALRNIEPLIDGCDAFTARESAEYVNNGFLGCTPGHPYIAELLETVRDRVLANPQWRSNRQSGPHHHTDVLQRHPDVRVLPREQIYPFRWDELNLRHNTFPDAFCIHHWNRKTQQLVR